jgi:hypothetical protein
VRTLKKQLWPYKVTIKDNWKHDITPIEIWLGENIGGWKDRWNVVYHYNATDFYFINSADAVMFTLRWSEWPSGK